MKKYLFFIILISVFVFPGSVKAQMYDLTPYYSEYGTDHNVSSNVLVTKVELYSSVFMYRMYTPNINNEYVRRAGSVFNLSNFQTGNYDLDFKININYNYPITTSYTQPIVSVNGKLCDVKPYTFTENIQGVMTQVYNWFFSVSCTNINFPDNNLDITTFFNVTNNVGIEYYAYDSQVSIFPSIKSSVSGIEDKIDEQTKQQHQDSQDIKNAIEGDNLDTDSIESSKNDSIDAYKNAESSLNLDGADLSGINIGLNPTASSKIWYVLQEHLNVNAKLMGFLISMLSIGLIKLFLGR